MILLDTDVIFNNWNIQLVETSLLFWYVFRDAAVCQQPGGGLAGSVWRPDDLSRFLTERNECHDPSRNSSTSNSPNSTDADSFPLPKCQHGTTKYPDTVSPVFTSHPSPHSCSDSLPCHRLFGAASGDPQSSAPSATASVGPAHPASAPTDSPAHHPGIITLFSPLPDSSPNILFPLIHLITNS